ncbi:uncharacterized protein DUF3800 [Geothermobacter ehrlichii]|uniref:Uncharacterized protein DUF3800 n=1 Tax=Geothermobacter ehrlichii TaxID=213224 RepID=A0A5D3WQW0_9BACT|nr:DUF3800 domain-containing protein [Geothermobacter ehrlichii]TYO99978.1 uncharacterized protein DUF3800 [Geothermobacter ehrlichii]
MKYRIYIDEVGNPDLESSDNPNHRFLSLTGVIIELGHVQDVVAPQLEALKREYFRSHPDEPVILHRKELVNMKNPFHVLKDPEVRGRFDKQLLRLLTDWQYSVISVCIDKKNHKDTYQVWRYEPYHYCLAVLLERYFFFLNEKGCQGDVMAESRGGKEDMRLKKSFAALWDEGTEYIPAEKFHGVLTSKQLKVKPKTNNVAGLQLADLLAHPSRNEILKEKDLLESGLRPFGQEIVKILREKYYQRDGRVFGKKFI